jgi:hypothetical protein
MEDRVGARARNRDPRQLTFSSGDEHRSRLPSSRHKRSWFSSRGGEEFFTTKWLMSLRTSIENENAEEIFLALLEMTKWNMAVISNERERSFFGPLFRRRTPRTRKFGKSFTKFFFFLRDLRAFVVNRFQ